MDRHEQSVGRKLRELSYKMDAAASVLAAEREELRRRERAMPTYDGPAMHDWTQRVVRQTERVAVAGETLDTLRNEVRQLLEHEYAHPSLYG